MNSDLPEKEKSYDLIQILKYSIINSEKEFLKNIENAIIKETPSPQFEKEWNPTRPLDGQFSLSFTDLDETKKAMNFIENNLDYIEYEGLPYQIKILDDEEKKGNLSIIYRIWIERKYFIEITIIYSKNFFEGEINQYQTEKVKFDLLVKELKVILSTLIKEVNPAAKIEGRAKSIFSFAGKLLRKPRINPCEEFMDLAAVRVIFNTLDEVEKFKKIINKNFICIENENTIERLGTNKFGYLSVHYTIQLKKEHPNYKKTVQNAELFQKRAELQVRTLLQHAWEQFDHNTVYKPNLRLPDSIKRRSARLAALLEEADKELQALQNEIQKRDANYGGYISVEKQKQELKQDRLLYECTKTEDNQEEIFPLLMKIVKNNRNLDNFDEIIILLEDFFKDGKGAKKKYSDAQRELGIAYNKSKKTHEKKLENAKNYLKKAIQQNPTDTDAISSLGGVFRSLAKEKTKKNEIKKFNRKMLEQYRTASIINPEDTYGLSNYVTEKLKLCGKKYPNSLIDELKIICKIIVKSCEEQIALSINFPWAFFTKGTADLILLEFEKALNDFMNGLMVLTSNWMSSTTALDEIAKIKSRKYKTAYKDEVRLIKTILSINKFYKNRENETLNKEMMNDEEKKNKNDEIRKLKLPLEDLLIRRSFNQSKKEVSLPENLFKNKRILILAGTVSDEEYDVQKLYFNSIQNAINLLENVDGIIISGGFKTGVNGIAGDIKNDKWMKIGYTNQKNKMECYEEYTYFSIGKDFKYDHENILQYWSDLCIQEVKAENIRLLIIGGGKMTAFEYQLGVLFRVKIGVLQDSAGTASKIIEETLWEYALSPEELLKKKPFKILKNDPNEIYKFLK